MRVPVLQLATAGLIVIALLSTFHFSIFASSSTLQPSGSAIRARRNLARRKYSFAAAETDRKVRADWERREHPHLIEQQSHSTHSAAGQSTEDSLESSPQPNTHERDDSPGPGSAVLALNPPIEKSPKKAASPSTTRAPKGGEAAAQAVAATPVISVLQQQSVGAPQAQQGAGAAQSGSGGPPPQTTAASNQQEPAAGGSGAVPEVEDPEARAEAVKKGMLHAWGSYERYAMGAAELAPLSKGPKNNVYGGAGISGLGVTVVDALSTLHLMGLTQEEERAHEWVASKLDFNRPLKISFFEATIRVLGGLVSAYDLVGDAVLLQKAVDLGERLMLSFNFTATGLPVNEAVLSGPLRASSTGPSLLAEVGSNSLEFGALGVRSGRLEFAAKAEVAMRRLHKAHPTQALLTTRIERSTGATTRSTVSVGPEADSYYEYLLKYWILMGKQDDHWRRRWEAAVDESLQELVPVFAGRPNLQFAASRQSGSLGTTLEHLTCFWPGNLALGVMHGAVEGAKAERYLDFAKKMTWACFQLYNITATGLGAEKVTFDPVSGEGHVTQPDYLQRPEVAESLFYLYRATGDEVYRQWGWQMFTAFEKHCRQEAGYAGVRDVDAVTPSLTNSQQSWLLAETFKYWYLLFSPPSALPLDQWLLNTEAHPLRVVTPTQFLELSATLAQHRRQEEAALAHRGLKQPAVIKKRGHGARFAPRSSR